MQHLKQYLRQNTWPIFLIIATGFVAAIFEGIGLSLIIPLLESVKGASSNQIPFPFYYLTQLISGMTLMHKIQLIAFLFVAVAVIKNICIYFNRVLTYLFQVKVIKYYRMLCFEQLMRLGMAFIDSQKKAHFQTILVTLTENIGSWVYVIGSTLPKMFMIFVFLVMLLFLSWKMTVLSFVIVAGVSLLFHKIARLAEIAGKDYTKSTILMNHIALDTLLGLKVIRLFNQEKCISKIFEEEVDHQNSCLFRLLKSRGCVQPFFETFGIFVLALILVVGSVMISPLQEGLQLMIVFVVVFVRMLPAAVLVNQNWVALKGDLPKFQEILSFLNLGKNNYLQNGTKSISQIHEGIRFEKMEFRYKKESPLVICDMNFDVKKGSKVGIVGPSGSGKSTFGDLLLRFYDPTGGRILVDGMDLRDIDVHSWRRMIGVVSQEIFLFNDTVFANIAFARPDATQEQVERAAQRAFAHDFIQNLPQGYQTTIGDRGVLMSGGERQRIAIARAILNEPEILLFDEATSSLDTGAEQIVQKALDQIAEGKTVFTIAHRLSTITNSDLILVINQGAIVQMGKHEELLGEKNSLYKQLVLRQSLDNKGSQVAA